MKKKDGIWMLGTGIVAIMVYCLVARIWNIDIRYPLVHGGDIAGLAAEINMTIRDESLWHFDGIGVPFYTNQWRQLFDGGLPKVFLFLFAAITKSVGLAYNMYYILTFGLAAGCTYYMLRKCGIREYFAFTGGVIYALIPGHFWRGQHHLFVGSCFAIPLVIVAGIALYKGKACKESCRDKERLSFKELLRSNSGELYLGLIFYALVFLSTLYYGIFALMFLTFCTFVCVCTTKKARHIFYYMEYVLVAILCLIVEYLPQTLADKFDPVVAVEKVVTRSRAEVEIYSGKLAQYILPVYEHRLWPLAKLRDVYDKCFPLINENGTSSLGLVMAVGFMAGLLVCCVCTLPVSKRILDYGRMELFLFLMSTVGGLSSLVGIFVFSLRCYNRFSFFIGAVGIVISMTILEEICDKFPLETYQRNKKKLQVIICIIVIMVAVYDQTTEPMGFSKERGQRLQELYKNDDAFVEAIETYEGENAKLMQFPIMNAQESALSITQEGKYLSYGEQTLFMHTKTSDWLVNGNGKPGESGERWADWLKSLPTAEQIKIAAIVDFDGIVLYNDGYNEDKRVEVVSTLAEMLGEPRVLHEGGNWAYYSINDVRDKLLSDYSDKEIAELRESYLTDFIEK